MATEVVRPALLMILVSVIGVVALGLIVYGLLVGTQVALIHLERCSNEFLVHYQRARPHQGLTSDCPSPTPHTGPP